MKCYCVMPEGAFHGDEFHTPEGEAWRAGVEHGYRVGKAEAQKQWEEAEWLDAKAERSRGRAEGAAEERARSSGGLLEDAFNRGRAAGIAFGYERGAAEERARVQAFPPLAEAGLDDLKRKVSHDAEAPHYCVDQQAARERRALVDWIHEALGRPKFNHRETGA